MSEKKFCIVIPIYKKTPDVIETISLQRLNKVIGEKNYDVYFITYEGLNIHKYNELFSTAKIEYFDKHFFDNTATYSQLCLSYDFYNRFNTYKYMYIYQTDCYLVTDLLETFCDLNFDYIGSPILSTDCGWPTVKQINGENVYCPVIGNGGFSLRKIETFLYILHPDGKFVKQTNFNDIFKDIAFEDLFICVNIPQYTPLNIATYEIGLLFSWDMSVDVIYDLWNNKRFPMAIHAWDKNIRFWKRFMPELKNNDSVIEFCEEKHKNFFKLYYNENDVTYR